MISPHERKTGREAPGEILAIQAEIDQVERELQAEIARLTQRSTALFGQWADAKWEAFRDRCLPRLPLQ